MSFEHLVITLVVFSAVILLIAFNGKVFLVALLCGSASLPSDSPRADTMMGGRTEDTLLSKTFAFDESYIFVGSFNLNPRSISLNTELGVYFQGPEYAASFSREFDARVLETAYRVELYDGQLVWTTLQDGKALRFDKEPETSWWKRFSTGFLSFIVPESML